MGYGPLSRFLESSKLLIENSRGLSAISPVLAEYGYDGARMDEGARIWAEAEALALAHKQAKESGEQHEATAEADKARAALESAYMKALKVARISFSEDAMASAALKLYGPRKQSLSGWMDQATTFYANLLGDPKLARKMLRFGFSAARLASESAALGELRRKIQAQAKETGEARAATAERDAKMRELDVWVSELRAICRVAFYDSPQELEKLGIPAQRGARRKKAEPEAAAATP